MTSWLEN